jgi:PhnB protein
MLQRRLSVLPLALALIAPACGPKNQPPPKPPTAEPEKAPVAPIPAGYFTLTPQLIVADVEAAIDFYTKVFGAQTTYSIAGADGKAMHAELVIGDSKLMVGLENEAQGAKSPLTLGGTPATLTLFVEDANAMFATAIGAGAKESMPLEEQFWGDLYGVLIDPSGHRWAIAQHVEDLTPEQMQQRAEIVNQPKKKGKKKPKKGTPPPWKAIAGTPATDATPAEYHSITIALTTSDANAAIAFYKAAFGATDKSLMPTPDGKVMHAELTFGDTVLMLSDEFPDMGGTSATTLGGSPVTVHMYTTDVDATFAQATGAGGKETMAVAVQPWGDRYGMLVDPVGFAWGLATHVEDVPPEEIQKRMGAAAPAAAPADAGGEPAADAAATPPAATP